MKCDDDPREPEEMGTDPSVSTPVEETDSLADFDDLIADQLSDNEDND